MPDNVRVVNAVIDESRLRDGSRVYVATVSEVPGVFAQAPTRVGVLADLQALLDNLASRGAIDPCEVHPNA